MAGKTPYSKLASLLWPYFAGRLKSSALATAPTVGLSAPTLNSVRLVGPILEMEWTPIPIAARYEVYRNSTPSADGKALLLSTTNTHLSFTYNRDIGQILFYNGGAELPLMGERIWGWSSVAVAGGAWERSSASAHTGTYSFRGNYTRPSAGPDYPKLVSYNYQVKPSSAYDIRGWVRTPTFGSGGHLWITVEWRNSAQTLVRSDNFDVIGVVQPAWTYFAHAYTSPADAAWVRVIPQVDVGVGATIDVYLDDLLIMGLAPPLSASDYFAVAAVDQDGNASVLSNWLPAVVVGAGLGTEDATRLIFDPAAPSIRLGTTDYSAGTGFYVGQHGGAYKFQVGDPAGQSIKWDGSVLTVEGTITAQAGTIGGCTIAASSISANYVAGSSGWKIGSDGSAEFENVKIRGAVQTAVFEKSVQSAFAGSLFVGPSAGTLAAALVIDNTAVPFSNTAHVFIAAPPAGGWVFATGDIVRLKAQHAGGVGDTWLTVTRTATMNEYTATVNYGTVNVTFPAGTAVVDYGASGAGFFGVAADGTYGASAAWILGTHGGQPWLGVGVANGITQQVYAGTDGKLYAGGGDVKLDAGGITLNNPGTAGSFQKLNLTHMGGASFAVYPQLSLAGGYYTPTKWILDTQTALDIQRQEVSVAYFSSTGVDISAGLNVGGGTGAGTGEIKASGNISTAAGLNVGTATGAPTGGIRATGITRVTADQGPFSGDGNSQIQVFGATDTTKNLLIGFETTNNYAFIQTLDLGVAFGAYPLYLQSLGGNVRVGASATDLLQCIGVVRADSKFNCAGTDGNSVSFDPITAIQTALVGDPPVKWIQVKRRNLHSYGGIVVIGNETGWTDECTI